MTVFTKYIKVILSFSLKILFLLKNIEGEIKDSNGNVIAEFIHFPLLKDYKLTIYDDKYNAESLLLLISSYYYDIKYDNFEKNFDTTSFEN